MAIRPIGRASFVAVWVWASVCAAATLDFGGLSSGTRFGRFSGNTPGEVVYSQDNIHMSVENFFFSTTIAFVDGEVGGRGSEAFFPTPPLFLDNLNTRFDFTQLGFTADRVSFDYLELGGLDNFAVNGRPIIEIQQLNNLPTVVAPGVTLVNELLDASSGRSRITLTGEIESLLIGGQELAINTIVAVPDPASLALLGLGLAPLAWVRSRRRRRSTADPH